jgi:hypothetical protein
MLLRQETAWHWMNIFSICGMHATKTTTNKIKTTRNDCGGIIGKSKQVDIFATSCSGFSLAEKTKSWTGVVSLC